MRDLVCFDLEGPLSPQDNAYEVMGLLPNGHKIFEVISRYDDLLALEGREEYEPGDTLALIVPFLVYHGITEQDVKRVSEKAYIVQGAVELIDELSHLEWKLYIVSTSYEQHAINIASRLGFVHESVYCTRFPLSKLKQRLKKDDLDLITDVEKHILGELYSEEVGTGAKDKVIKPYLDWFYWDCLPKTSVGIPNKTIEVLGGRRKVWAMERIARYHDVSLANIAFIGDSITDAQATKVIEAAGGLSIAFNGNAFVVPYATIGVASMRLKDIQPILRAWSKGGRAEVKRSVVQMRKQQTETGPFYDWLVGKSKQGLKNILDTHKRTRSLVRSEAAKLG